MKPFTVYNASGNIVRTGYCLPQDFQGQAQAGERVVEGIVSVNPAPPIFNYTYERAQAYPKTGDQLDAIFKLAKALQAQGISLPADTIAWINEVQSVKDTYPKGGV